MSVSPTKKIFVTWYTVLMLVAGWSIGPAMAIGMPEHYFGWYPFIPVFFYIFGWFDMYVNDQSNVLLQQPETFRSGKWEYRCKKTLNGYNVLIRSDGVTEQAIVEMSGKVLPTWHYIGVAVGAAAISLVLLRNRKRRKCS